MSEDDRAVMERLAALEAEVTADAEAQRARKQAAMEKVREQRATQQAEREELRARQAELVTRKQRPTVEDGDDDGGNRMIESLALAKRASDVKHELTKPTKAGEKSIVKSGIASMLLGPLGWLYAGSMREAIPASAAWLAFAALASKFLPSILLFPVLFVALPLSGIAGALYAHQYNKKGSRQRLFGDKKQKAKQLPAK